MNKQIIALAVITAVTTSVGYGAPDLLEIHEQVSDKLRTVGSLLLPAPLFELIDSVPPGATPHEKILRLAQAPAPPGEPFVDPAAIADWANNLATITTQRTLDGLFPRSAPRKPVIVGSSDAKGRATMEEDLNVMMRILEKAAGGKNEPRPTAGGIELFSFGKSSGPRVFYLEGYGAMFVLNVKYPLLAPPPRDDQGHTNEPANTEWEKAKEEVYGRRKPSDEIKFNAAQGEEFDPQRVEDLKEQIIDDLVNAKNIRGLKSDDYVTVVVLGGGTRGTIRREIHSPRTGGGGGGFGGGGGGRGGAVAVMETSGSSEGGAQTTMTLRGKKSDIDALAKGKLNAEEFRKKVSVQVY
jgi:hypothetical protein